METTHYHLDAKDMPRAWYNIQADLPDPLEPPLNPVTKKPADPADLMKIFPMEILKQEMGGERFIEIPDEVLDIYAISRPTPLIRARNLEKALDTPAKIFFKYEGANPAGSH
ncbi:MAG TPA: TrpB-like pyridoxal-phosphate dependent enzyme, partial [Ignavibacteriales bacterium]|nr:TrpB-like pyridoxal-phosphate dependent enzyme [Ignavibacteriales bacterium]